MLMNDVFQWNYLSYLTFILKQIQCRLAVKYSCKEYHFKIQSFPIIESFPPIWISQDRSYGILPLVAQEAGISCVFTIILDQLHCYFAILYLFIMTTIRFLSNAYGLYTECFRTNYLSSPSSVACNDSCSQCFYLTFR